MLSFNSTIPADWDDPKGDRRLAANQVDLDDGASLDELRAMAAALLLVADELSEVSTAPPPHPHP
ncbi:MAG: hypothetical protein ACRD0C_18265 [Acidimicrobiia bacterium]